MKRQLKPDFSLLIFSWKVRDRSMFRLAAALLMTIGVLIALCVSFRIITPEPHSVTTRPHQLLVLNPDIPAERALIHQAMDRSFPLLPADGGSNAIPSSAVMPAFRPAIASFELRPKLITPSAATANRPQFFALDLDVGQPVPKPVQSPVVDSVASVLKAVVEGEITPRSPDKTALSGIPLIEPTKPQFRVAVGPLGQVLMALPLYATEDVKVMAQLHAAVTALRFKPAKSEVEWGQISFRWEKEANP